MRTILPFLLFFVCFSKIWAQRLELGGFFGISTYLGDLQQPQIELLEINQAKGLFMRYNLSGILAVKSSFIWGKISGNDANYTNIYPISQRNLSFQSDLYEASLQLEAVVMRFGDRKNYRSKSLSKRGSPKEFVSLMYIFTGVSGFHFNPKARYQNEWIELQPLGTEGQGMEGCADKYNRLQLSIPAGFGFRINCTDWSSFGFELGIRKTFTDYLDDVSTTYPDLNALQDNNPMAAALSFRTPELTGEPMTVPEGTLRGNDKIKDFYLFGGLSFSITLPK